MSQWQNQEHLLYEYFCEIIDRLLTGEKAERTQKPIHYCQIVRSATVKAFISRAPSLRIRK
jgi:hypothetical protein